MCEVVDCLTHVPIGVQVSNLGTAAVVSTKICTWGGFMNSPANFVRKQKALEVGHFEESGRQPRAGDLDPSQARLDSGHILTGKAHLGRAEVFIHTVQSACAEDRHDPGPSCEEPGERQLRGRGALGRGEPFDRLDHSLVGFHRLGS
jgi:hypothetical protein